MNWKISFSLIFTHSNIYYQAANVIQVALTNSWDYYWYVLHQNGLLIIAYRIEGSVKSILPRQISDGIYLLFLSFFV